MQPQHELCSHRILEPRRIITGVRRRWQALTFISSVLCMYYVLALIVLHYAHAHTCVRTYLYECIVVGHSVLPESSSTCRLSETATTHVPHVGCVYCMLGMLGGVCALTL